MKTKTQTDMVLEYMIKHGSITSIEAIKELSCTRLAHQIWLLRRRGILIHTDWVVGRNRFHQPVRFAKYILDDDYINLAS